MDILDPEQVTDSTPERTKQRKESQQQQRRLEQDKKKIIDTVAKFPTGETKTTIRDTSGLHTERFNQALAALLSEGQLVPCQIFKGVRKMGYEGYKLPEENHP